VKSSIFWSICLSPRGFAVDPAERGQASGELHPPRSLQSSSTLTAGLISQSKGSRGQGVRLVAPRKEDLEMKMDMLYCPFTNLSIYKPSAVPQGVSIIPSHLLSSFMDKRRASLCSAAFQKPNKPHANVSLPISWSCRRAAGVSEDMWTIFKLKSAQ